jgi:hypothetical protein
VRVGAARLEARAASEWNANLNGDVHALLVNGSTLYAGGSFTTAGGQDRNHIAAIDLATGQATDWDPNADHDVLALAVDGDALYSGGSFSRIGGQPRSGVAALDLASGLAQDWSVETNGLVRALAAGHGRLYLGGEFTQIGSESRYHVGAVDLRTGALSPWTPGWQAGNVWVLTLGGTMVYVGGDTHYSFEHVPTLVAVDAISGAGRWELSLGDRIRALELSGSALYVGGTFWWYSSMSGGRNHIAAVDAGNGMILPWRVYPDETVRAIRAEPSAVYLGGEFRHVNDIPTGSLAAVTTDLGTPATPALFTAEARQGVIEVAWALEDEAVSRSARLERSLQRAGPWEPFAIDVGGEGNRRVAVDADVRVGVTYWYRLRWVSKGGVALMLGPISATVVDIPGVSLGEPTPCPSTRAVRMELYLQRAGRVRVEVTDAQGRRVSRVDSEYGAGRHSLVWNGEGEKGTAPSGLYFIRVVTTAGVYVRRALMIR